MKKIILIALVFSLFAISLVSAVTFEMKDNFNQEELLIAKISGDFINPPLKENIFLYRKHVTSAINPYLAKIGNDYYLYALLSGKKSDNYSLVIENIEYKKGSIIVKENLIKNFTINDSLASFIVNKGFIVTKENFYLDIENLQAGDLEITLNLETISGQKGGIVSFEEERVLTPGEERINFELETLEGPTVKLLTISSENLNYSIPISLVLDDFSEQNKIFMFNIEPLKVDLIIPTTGDQIKRLIYIYNTGTGALTDIELTLSNSLKPYVTISEDNFGRIIPGSNANLNLIITPAGEKTITGELFIETKEGIAGSSKITIEFKEGAKEMAPELKSDQKCASLGGICCFAAQGKCDGDDAKASDCTCCIGKCVKKVESSLGKVFGWLIILILIACLAWFFLKKYKNVKNPVNLLKKVRIRKR